MNRSSPAIEGAIRVLGAEHPFSKKLSLFLHEIQPLHEVTQRDLQHCQSNHSILFHRLPSDDILIRSTKAATRILRFSRKEVEFVRILKGKAPVNELALSFVREFPKWQEVDMDRIIAKIRRVRRPKEDQTMDHEEDLYDGYTDEEDDDHDEHGEKRSRLELSL